MNKLQAPTFELDLILPSKDKMRVQMIFYLAVIVNFQSSGPEPDVRLILFRPGGSKALAITLRAFELIL